MKNEFGLEWLPPPGFNNTNAIMMRKEDTDTLKLNTISDLKKYLIKQ